MNEGTMWTRGFVAVIGSDVHVVFKALKPEIVIILNN